VTVNRLPRFLSGSGVQVVLQQKWSQRQRATALFLSGIMVKNRRIVKMNMCSIPFIFFRQRDKKQAGNHERIFAGPAAAGGKKRNSEHDTDRAASHLKKIAARRPGFSLLLLPSAGSATARSPLRRPGRPAYGREAARPGQWILPPPHQREYGRQAQCRPGRRPG